MASSPAAGVVRQTLSVSSASHGQPVLLDMQAGHLAVLTSTGMVLVYDARGPEAKAQAGPGRCVCGCVAVWLLRCCWGLSGTVTAVRMLPASSSAAPAS
jgi:hypothetical protein